MFVEIHTESQIRLSESDDHDHDSQVGCLLTVCSTSKRASFDMDRTSTNREWMAEETGNVEWRVSRVFVFATCGDLLSTATSKSAYVCDRLSSYEKLGGRTSITATGLAGQALPPQVRSSLFPLLEDLIVLIPNV